MLVTREADYAVRTVLYLARNSTRTTSVAEVARAMHIPKSFLAKIVQHLVRRHILVSIRGMKGGFMLAVNPSKISLLDILESIQGPTGINVCAIDSRKCRLSATCSVHPVWVQIRKEVERRLKKQTIAGLL